MCGFIGRIVPAGVTASRPLEAGVPWLARCGPDSQRLWSAPAEGPGQVDLLHVRLAIIDFTERAHQPMWHAGRRVALVFNGEIYNYADVRAELPDFAFTTESDTEVILATYLAGGLGALRRLKGMFTVAILRRGGRACAPRTRRGRQEASIRRALGRTDAVRHVVAAASRSRRRGPRD